VRRVLSGRRLTVLMIGGIVLSMTFLAWFGYRTIREWRRSSLLLDRQRADAAADLLVTALTRDMRAVQTSVLSQESNGFLSAEPYDISDLVASAFARYPYPEAFFVQQGTPVSHPVFYARSSRLPLWVKPDVGRDRFPVTTLRPPAFSAQIGERVAWAARRRQPFVVFELSLSEAKYQVVARLFYRDRFREELDGVFGFMVNLTWVRQHYFQDLAAQVARIGNTHAGVTLSVLDNLGHTVASTAKPTDGAVVSRAFPMMFFDPLLAEYDAPSDLPRRSWVVEAQLGDDAIAGSSVTAINRTLSIAGVAVVILGLGLVLTARAARANIRLGEMRSEFVSTVTHELKTPIATIRAVGDTLAGGRIAGASALHDYAQLVVQESKRLTRLVDNMLAYARITDVTKAYEFASVELSAIVDEVQSEFRHQLNGGLFQVDVDIPQTLPPVRADRTAVVLMLNNLVDNAIRYSGTEHFLAIRARQAGSLIAVEIVDHGVGIPEEEIPHVVRRFVRGRQAGSSGSGLGMAIASRIATDHHGHLSVASTVNEGTTVTVTLPVA
jgi:signal transduction histidine kinase